MNSKNQILYHVGPQKYQFRKNVLFTHFPPGYFTLPFLHWNSVVRQNPFWVAKMTEFLESVFFFDLFLWWLSTMVNHHQPPFWDMFFFSFSKSERRTYKSEFYSFLKHKKLDLFFQKFASHGQSKNKHTFFLVKVYRMSFGCHSTHSITHFQFPSAIIYPSNILPAKLFKKLTAYGRVSRIFNRSEVLWSNRTLRESLPRKQVNLP